MVEPLRVFEGVRTDVAGETRRYTSAVYPPQFYDYWRSWACALRLSFAPNVFHFGYGKNAEHAIQRAFEEVRGFVGLMKVQLVNEDGFDLKIYTALGYKLPWNDDVINHPALASYTPPRYEPKSYSTPDEPPVRKFRGWHTIDAEMEEVVGTVYAPDCDADGRWGCIVSCPAIFGSNKRIPGVDAGQALELAEWFLIDLWNYFGIEPKLDQIELTYAARLR